MTSHGSSELSSSCSLFSTVPEMGIDPTRLRCGSIVVIHAFDDIPEHLFQIDEVLEDCVTGFALSGPLTGEYGEPDLALIKAIHRA